MMTSTSTLDEKICEQLCAYMDGELSETEARFLLRRLEQDGNLRAKWERLQLASACLKNQPVQLMPTTLCDSITAQLSEHRNARTSRHPLWGWAVAASFAAIAVTYTPRMRYNPPSEVISGIASSTAIPTNSVASPASADLVAVYAKTPANTALVATSKSKTTVMASLDDSSVVPVESPLPLTAQSPENFPLIDNGDKKTWPRSIASISPNDPALEAYLVRHNQMLADDSFGGFFPYVDVVANAQPNASANQDGKDSNQ